MIVFFFSSRRRHTRWNCDWSSDVCSSDLIHDLNVERDNHHVLWLKYSYPLRQLVVEIERRLITSGSLDKGDIFFLQAPELIEAARNLPAPLTPDLIAKVKN